MPALASRMWDQIVEDLEDAGMIARCDAATLELALRHYALAVKASNTLNRASVIKRDDKNKREMRHPASQIFHAHSNAFMEYAKQMGLTFVSRARTPFGGQEGPTDGNNPLA
ncbi:P27 family phage terminase small subunit [Jonesiaceae bacterium BS-20]|uniref:P27 family phage terminase small subunit n=1 Tax=Jonesiaceae bacterium BS-20 TaxID=3120821 RepID=A0AAU7DXZ7_9MICO